MVLLTRYTHARDVPHAEHVGSWWLSVYASSPLLCSLPTTMLVRGYYDAALFSAYPVYGLSVSKVNCFVAGVQIFSFHCRTVVSSLKCRLYLWTRSLAWCCRLSSKSFIVL